MTLEDASSSKELTPHGARVVTRATGTIACAPPPIEPVETSSALPSFRCDYPMIVMRWASFEALDALPRSDAAAARGLLVSRDSIGDSSEVTCFISHSWWQRVGDEVAPDFTSGDRKGLKFDVIRRGVRELIAREGLDPARLSIWCDWFCIDQRDAALKAAGVRSMIHYVTRCDLMLIPVPTSHVVNAEYADGADPDDCAAYYPEDVADYGLRGWCRVEYFIFGLFSEMAAAAARRELAPLRLYAVARRAS